MLIRCIGDPDERFGEDALRMLRAVRFAAQLGFEIEEGTLRSVGRNAHLLKNVSRERVAMELFRLVSSPHPLKGIVPLFSTGLADYALPGFARGALAFTLRRFAEVTAEHDPMLGMAMLLADAPSGAALDFVEGLKLSSADAAQLAGSLTCLQAVRRTREGTLADMKRLARRPGLPLALEIYGQDELVRKTSHGMTHVIGTILDYKALGPEDIRLEPLVTGKDLIEMGLKPGPVFSEILDEVEEGQLNGVLDRETALARIKARTWGDERGETARASIL